MHPARNVVHVTCMLHAKNVILMYMHHAICMFPCYCTCMFHVACMDFGRFSCMLHACDMLKMNGLYLILHVLGMLE